jgi:hypothetical protein
MPVDTNILPSQFRALGGLGLTTCAMESLAAQGFVSSEVRGTRTVYKLRYRLERCQKVCFLGDDADRAKDVARELEILQRGVRERRQHRTISRTARRALRVAKFRLQHIVEQDGFHYSWARDSQTASAEESILPVYFDNDKEVAMNIDSQLDEPIDEEHSDVPQPENAAIDERSAAFQQHVTSYEVAADSDELDRALAYVMGYLLNVTSVVGDAIKEYSQRGGISVEDLKTIKEPMDSFFKLTRQIERFRSLELRPTPDLSHRSRCMASERVANSSQ